MYLQKSLFRSFHMLHMEASRENAWILHPPFNLIDLPNQAQSKAMHGSFILDLSILC